MNDMNECCARGWEWNLTALRERERFALRAAQLKMWREAKTCKYSFQKRWNIYICLSELSVKILMVKTTTSRKNLFDIHLICDHMRLSSLFHWNFCDHLYKLEIESWWLIIKYVAMTFLFLVNLLCWSLSLFIFLF